VSKLDELAADVRSAEGETRLVTGLELREAAGESRLKERARERVEERLRGVGLSVWPEVPDRQRHEVYVTRMGSAVDRLHQAILNPSDDNLKQLLAAAGSGSVVVEQRDALGELRDVLKEAQGLAAKAAGEGD
jgi:hypothetical protein